MTAASTRSCPPLWTQDPAVLLRDATDFYPFSAEARRCVSTALNSLVRFGVYLGVALALLTRNALYVGVSVALAGVAASVGASHARTNRSPFPATQMEGFQARRNAAYHAAPVCREPDVDVIQAPAGGATALDAKARAVLQELQGGALPQQPPHHPGDVFRRGDRQFVAPPAGVDTSGAYEAWLFAGVTEGGSTPREALLPPTCREGQGQGCRPSTGRGGVRP